MFKKSLLIGCLVFFVLLSGQISVRQKAIAKHLADLCFLGLQKAWKYGMSSPVMASVQPPAFIDQWLNPVTEVVTKSVPSPQAVHAAVESTKESVTTVKEKAKEIQKKVVAKLPGPIREQDREGVSENDRLAVMEILGKD